VVLSLLESFSDTAECKRIKESEILGREIPFLLPWEGSVMRGRIDLICRHKGVVTIIDFKTGKRISDGKEIYEMQAKVYREAVKRILGIPDPKVEFIFLRNKD
jgi:ATP-dependent helicase/nuclease subunit A